MLTYAIRKTTLCVALTLAVSTQALAATEIPFWHSMEGELGKEVDSLATALTSRTATSKSFRFIKATTNRAWRRALRLTAPARRRRFCKFTKWAPPP